MKKAALLFCAVLVFLGLSILGLMLSNEARAMRCTQRTLEEDFKNYDLVFAAEVIHGVPEKTVFEDRGFILQRLKLNIKNVWKGKPLTSNAILIAYAASYVTKAELSINKTYLFFVQPSDPLQIDVSCRMPDIITDDIEKKLNQLAPGGEIK